MLASGSQRVFTAQAHTIRVKENLFGRPLVEFYGVVRSRMPTRLCTTRAAASPLALLLLAPALRASSSNGRDARGLLDGSGTDVGGGSGSLAAAANAGSLSGAAPQDPPPPAEQARPPSPVLPLPTAAATMAPAPLPPALGYECEESCRFSSDGICDDGGEGSAFAACEIGTDCVDCGPRLDLPPPSPYPPGDAPRPPQPSQPPPPVPAYLATTVVELRQLWMQALRDEADAAIEVPPGSNFRLRGRPLTCRKDIRLTVFSSGAGATLDGMNESQIFRLHGCSLTLRGLTLVNGYPEAGLKAACRDQRTGRWRPYEESWKSSYWRNSVYKPECMYVVCLVRSDPGMPSHPAQGYPSASALLRTAARSMPSRRHLVPLPPWPSSR